MENKKRFLVIHFLCWLSALTGMVWGVVEGMKYFIKDDHLVNWLFLVPFIVGYLVIYINVFSAMDD